MLIEKTKKKTLGGVRLPKVHGHTVLTLTDAKTGREVRRIEKDNLVTDAVARIFLQNYLGAIKYADITPVRDMFGGVLLFYDALTESEDAVTFPDPSVNPVIAYAGQTAHATANTKRGNPNNAQGGSGPTLDGKGYKFVWDWATNQGNGTISSAALTFKDFGDIGPDPNPCVDREQSFIITSAHTLTMYGGNRTERGEFENNIHTPVCITDDGATAWTFDYTTKTLKKCAVNYKAQGVNNVLTFGEIVETFTLTNATLSKYGSITYEASTGLFYLVEFPSTSQCVIYEFDPATETLTSKSFSGEGVTFSQVEPPQNAEKAAYINKFAKCGDFFFVYGGTGMLRLDWTQPSDIEDIDLTAWDTSERPFAADIVNFGQIPTGESCCLGAGYSIYGLKIYTTEKLTDDQKINLIGTAVNVSYFGAHAVRYALTDDPHILIPWVWGYGSNASVVFSDNACVMYAPYLATVQNLEDVVTKDSTMTMKVAYTITIDDTPEP